MPFDIVVSSQVSSPSHSSDVENVAWRRGYRRAHRRGGGQGQGGLYGGGVTYGELLTKNSFERSAYTNNNDSPNKPKSSPQKRFQQAFLSPRDIGGGGGASRVGMGGSSSATALRSPGKNFLSPRKKGEKVSVGMIGGRKYFLREPPIVATHRHQ